MLLVVWSVSTIWRVASGTLLENTRHQSYANQDRLTGGSCIPCGVVTLLITLTTKIVNRGKDLEFATDESIRKLDDMKAVMQRHEEGHPDIQSEAERMQAEVSAMAETVIEVKREAERVVEENEQSPQTVDSQR